ncbi:MAG TPA: DUF6166 domain-containing protein [Xanthobacteraceae bacterium]|nr:DUF6166 domain-containing protein [Xanthobacteraceae bacterium]
MKTYHGWRDTGGLCHITVREPFRRNRPLDPPRGHVASPAGFDWGSAGSGPAQTALALLADALGDDERAVRLHQHFKFAVIGRLDRREPWDMTDAQIIEIAARLEGRPVTPAATERPARRPADLRHPTLPSRRPSNRSGSTKRTKGG